MYGKLFEGVDFGEAISPNYETVGIESVYLIINLGSLGVIIMLYPFLFLAYYLMGICSNFKFCRKQRKRLGKNLFWGAVLRLIIESYMIGFLCCAVNFKNLNFDYSQRWEFTNTVLATTLISIFILFPIFSTRYLIKHFVKLRERSFTQTYGELYHGLNLERKRVLLFVMMDYIRKMTLAIVVVFY